MTWDPPSDYESPPDPRFLLVNLGNHIEDLENYAPSGFHPVHLGDLYDNGRYRVVHKLGSGGFSTVWLARDELDQKWVALKIVLARDSATVEGKCRVFRDSVRPEFLRREDFVVEERWFTFDGPNGRHLCLVLPVLGPCAAELSDHFDCRMRPALCRTVAFQVANALAALHDQGLCHGDLTLGNILFALKDIDSYTEGDLYHLFGTPETAPLETESGEIPGPEAPRYIVKPLEFLSSNTNLISTSIKISDFDQSFPASSSPDKILGIPPDFMAPEIAVGRPASPASDVWALGCCIFRLRAGSGIFSSDFEVTSPADLLRIVVQTIGDMPQGWKETLFDYFGQPTKDPKRGRPFKPWSDERSMKKLVEEIWDEPSSEVVTTGVVKEKSCWECLNMPLPECFKDMVWKPSATKVDGVYLPGNFDELDELLEVLPKIPADEAALLLDLLSKIFVYHPPNRPTARELLDHPWFHMDDLVIGMDEGRKMGVSKNGSEEGGHT